MNTKAQSHQRSPTLSTSCMRLVLLVFSLSFSSFARSFVGYPFHRGGFASQDPISWTTTMEREGRTRGSGGLVLRVTLPLLVTSFPSHSHSLALPWRLVQIRYSNRHHYPPSSLSLLPSVPRWPKEKERPTRGWQRGVTCRGASDRAPVLLTLSLPTHSLALSLPFTQKH